MVRVLGVNTFEAGDLSYDRFFMAFFTVYLLPQKQIFMLMLHENGIGIHICVIF